MKRQAIGRLLVLVIAGLMLSPLGVGSVAGIDGQGDITNQLPYATGTDTDRLEIDALSFDNSGSDVLTLYFTFKDNNSEADISIGATSNLLIYIEPAANNDGFDQGTDVPVLVYQLSATQVGGKCWIDDAGGATNGSNDDGDTTDGYLEIEDENDDDDNFEFTIPGSWATSSYYSAQINFSDGGAEQESWLVLNFAVISSLTYSMAYSDGTWGTSYWGEWSAEPTDSAAPSDPDAATISWLVVNNTGANPSQQFTVSFGAENFTGTSHSRWINIDYNIRWTYYQTNATVGSGKDPDDVDWEDGNWTAADDADGDYTFQFTHVSTVLWIIYELAQVTEDDGTDTAPVIGHNYDNVLRDDSYTVTYTVTAV